MTTDYFAPRRLEPLHTPEAKVHAVEDVAKNNDMQHDEAASNAIPEHAGASPEDFTISVDQVREHFRSKGLTKSKDTVQRWCRTGDLDCQKRGVLGRYFTTETSLLKLEQKLLPDMIAENAGHQSAMNIGMQQDAAASEAPYTDVPVHASTDQPARSDMQLDEGNSTVEHSAARIEVPTLSLMVVFGKRGQ